MGFVTNVSRQYSEWQQRIASLNQGYCGFSIFFCFDAAGLDQQHRWRGRLRCEGTGNRDVGREPGGEPFDKRSQTITVVVNRTITFATSGRGVGAAKMGKGRLTRLGVEPIWEVGNAAPTHALMLGGKSRLGLQMTGPGKKILIGGLIAGWIAVTGSGMFYLARYQTTAGAVATTPMDWPSDSKIARRGDRDTLVLFAHPKCPCTTATMTELAIVMTECRDRLDTTVMFVRPPGMPVGWEKTDLWTTAAAIPGVTVRSDVGGVESARFGAQTSGQAVLFDRSGRLLFCGGITPGRAHEGDNAGRDSIVARVLGTKPAATQTPVFGCALIDSPTALPTGQSSGSCSLAGNATCRP